MVMRAAPPSSRPCRSTPVFPTRVGMNLFWLFDGWLRSMYSVLAYPALVFPLASLARRLNWDHTVKLGTLPFTVNLNQGYAGNLSRFSHKTPV
ncbi:hypothetical protein CPSG_03895 [Coccidioides posadasii str. Silveira]|uniref:Uncharacterized protein n=1 Tax=Coccidioides posadasii (strain RMSCC 757 / Silveira) TaxID=443226 RepID=E9D2U7_COCPS|nr:hypothetical protein CPSG_03895 [Coccidioides posadasii str. Silveira]